jgi:endonuclease G
MNKISRTVCASLIALITPIASIAIQTSTKIESNFNCSNFLEYGIPGSTNQYLCRDGYAVGYSYMYKQPLWVAYELTGKSVTRKIKRHDDFQPDLQIPKKYRAEKKDYSRSGYDRGHMAPYAAMDFDKESAKQSFLLSNMSPQKGSLNRQGWAQLEKYVRFWAKSKNKIWVYTGPIFKGKKIKTIGKGKISVPSAFYKIIYAPEQNQTIAFVMPNSKVNRKQVSKYIVPISQIEQRTGLRFLSNLPLEDKSKLVNSSSKMWRVKY